MKRSIRLATVAAVILIGALGYQAGIPGWAYAGAAAGAGAAIGTWSKIELRVARWMPDDEFPKWMIANLSAGQADRKPRS